MFKPSEFKGVSSCERNFSFNNFKGPRTVWPNTSSKGLKPRDSCTDSITAKRKRCIYLHPKLFLCQNSMTLSYFSRCDEIFQGHLDCDDLYCLIPSSFITVWKTPGIKFEP